MANETVVHASDYGVNDDFGYYQGYCAVGNSPNSYTLGVTDGALRFTNIQISKNASIDFAELVYVYDGVGEGEGQWYWDLFGIDEDNTNNFSSSPFGRSRTTASASVRNLEEPTAGGVKKRDVKSIVSEITSRSGWSSGNAMGFLCFDAGSDDEVGARTDSESYLAYRVSSEPDFTPTPVTLSAPSLPSAKDYGIKIAKPGTNVLTASEEDLYFTTRRDQFKVYDEGEITVGASGIYTINHNLGYIPFAEAFAESGSFRVRLPDLEFDADQSPSGYLEITSSQLKIYSESGTDVYYYIFLNRTN